MRITTMAALLLLFAVTAPTSGCDSVAGCDEDTQVLEATYDLFYEATEAIVRDWEARGYDCVSEGIRNFAGTRIGTKWTCTGCR